MNSHYVKIRCIESTSGGCEIVKASSKTLESAGEIEEGSRLMKQDPIYLAIGTHSFLAITVLERLAAGLESVLLRTEIFWETQKYRAPLALALGKIFYFRFTADRSFDS